MVFSDDFFVENLSLALLQLPTKFQSNPPSYLGGDSGLSIATHASVKKVVTCSR
jgi:hypothetical protein